MGGRSFTWDPSDRHCNSCLCCLHVDSASHETSGEMLIRWELIAVDPLIADGRGSWGSFGNFGSHAKEV